MVVSPGALHLARTAADTAEAGGGVAFRHVLAARGPMPLGVAVDVMLQLCRKLASAHARGVAHLALGPATVRMTESAEGLPVVHIHPPSHAAPTGTGFAAPEQVLGTAEAGARADVFALGAIFYELVTGQPAFPSDPARFFGCLHEGIPAMNAFTWVPPDVEQIVFRCMSPSEVGRFADAIDLGRALEQVLAPAPFGSDPLGPMMPTSPSFLPGQFAAPAPLGSDLREHWPLVVLPPIVVFLAMALVHVVVNGAR